MREKNIKKAAEALFQSQGDDKNKLLATFIENKDARKIVKAQGRALLILERLCLPEGKFSFTEDEMYSSLMKKLEKKGHRIQKDDEEDTEQFTQEKEQAKTERLAMVNNVLGKTLDELPAEEEEGDQSVPVHKDEFGNVVEEQLDEELQEALQEQIIAFGTPAEQEEIEVEEYDLPEVAWQLIGQAYIDGIRTGRDSAA